MAHYEATVRKEEAETKLPSVFTQTELETDLSSYDRFQAWTNEQLLRMINDCRQAQVAMLNDAIDCVNIMRTFLAHKTHWSAITPDEARDAMRAVAAATTSIVHE